MGVLCWPPDSFWASTTYDVECAMEGYRRANEVTPTADSTILTQADLDRFMAMPDEIT